MADISVETQKAQAYLNGINEAINRDEIIAEEKNKKLKDLDKQIKSLESTISALQNEENEVKAKVISAQEIYKAKRDSFNEENNKLEQIMSWLTQSIVELEQKMVDTTKLATDNEVLLEKHFEMVRWQYEKDHATILSEIDNLSGEIVKLKSEWQAIVFKNEKLVAELKDNEDKVAWQTKLLGDMLEKQRQLDNLDQTINLKQDIVAQMNTDIENLNKEVTEVKEEQKKVVKELEAQKEEVADFNKQKVILANEKQVLLQKEEKLAFVCSQAWITI